MLRTCAHCARIYDDDDALFCGTCGIPLDVPAARGLVATPSPRPAAMPSAPIAAAAEAMLASQPPVRNTGPAPDSPPPPTSIPTSTPTSTPTPAPGRGPAAAHDPAAAHAPAPTATAAATPTDPAPRADLPPADTSIYGYLYELGGKPRQHPLRRGDTKLGAGNNNDIVIDRAAVSWNHALFICRNGRILLQDSASTNGTFVNGKRLRSPRALRHGDTVRFGDVEFRVWIQAPFRDLE